MSGRSRRSESPPRKREKPASKTVMEMDRNLRRLAKKHEKLDPTYDRHANFALTQGRFQRRFLREAQERMTHFEARMKRRPTERERDKIEAEVEAELVPEMENEEKDITRHLRRRGVMRTAMAHNPPPDQFAADFSESEEDDLAGRPPAAPPVPRNDINGLIQDFMG